MTAAGTNRGAGARTLELLRCIASGEREFALKDLAERAGLASSTAHRLLEEWVERDLLQRAGPKAYRLGPQLFRLAALLVQKYEPSRIAEPILRELRDQWEETATFCLLNPTARTATVAASIASPHPLKYELAPHSVISLVWGSLGRAILAQLPPNDVLASLQQSRSGPLSGRPPPSHLSLRRDLELIRRQGYALYEDSQLNIAGVSAPVTQAEAGIIGSLGLILPATRFTRKLRQHLPSEVIASAQRLSAALGAR